jgi:hypothetical protein
LVCGWEGCRLSPPSPSGARETKKRANDQRCWLKTGLRADSSNYGGVFTKRPTKDPNHKTLVYFIIRYRYRYQRPYIELVYFNLCHVSYNFILPPFFKRKVYFFAKVKQRKVWPKL